MSAQDVHSSAWFAYVSLSNWCAMTTTTLVSALFAIIVFSFMLASGGNFVTKFAHTGDFLPKFIKAGYLKDLFGGACQSRYPV